MYCITLPKGQVVSYRQVNLSNVYLPRRPGTTDNRTSTKVPTKYAIIRFPKLGWAGSAPQNFNTNKLLIFVSWFSLPWNYYQSHLYFLSLLASFLLLLHPPYLLRAHSDIFISQIIHHCHLGRATLIPSPFPLSPFSPFTPFSHPRVTWITSVTAELGSRPTYDGKPQYNIEPEVLRCGGIGSEKGIQQSRDLSRPTIDWLVDSLQTRCW